MRWYTSSEPVLFFGGQAFNDGSVLQWKCMGPSIYTDQVSPPAVVKAVLDLSKSMIMGSMVVSTRSSKLTLLTSYKLGAYLQLFTLTLTSFPCHMAWE